MRKIFHLLALFFLIFSFYSGLPAQQVYSASYSDVQRGYEAFRNEDWISASLFLRKAVSSSSNATDENYFMLIKSEIYSGEYKMAQEDCQKFLSLFPLSVYAKYIQYQNGRMLHLLGKNDEAVVALGDFCRQNYDDELYPLALYWIAEAFYDEYNFGPAKGLYKRLVSDFPNCEKVSDSLYKLDLIAQREREEKLLYLIKAISEENLSTREEYERQLKAYEMQKKLDANQKQNQKQQVSMMQTKKLENDNKTATKLSESKLQDKKNIPSAETSSDSVSSDSVSSENAVESAAGSVQIVNEPSLHIRRRSASDKNPEELKKKAEEIPYVIEK